MPAHFRSPWPTWQYLKEPARHMRHEPTHAENVLWERVRDRRLSGYKFRRQYTIGPFIVDFVCLERTLIIEVDGAIHDRQVEEDANRQGFLEQQGFQVMRFVNDEVLRNPEAVLAQVLDMLATR